MRFRLLISFTLSLTTLAPGQNPNPPVRIPDGGVNGAMQSIFIPPKAGAPFSLTLDTEWTRPMENGGTVTFVNERHIMRDSKGRIYQERWMLVPKGGNLRSQMNVFQITDPELHTWFNCEVLTKVCELLQYRLTDELTYLPPTETSGPLPEGSGSRLHEDLGSDTYEGVETHGYRETLTINQGVMVNEKPIVTVREFWYSPHLAISLQSIVDSPFTGRQVFRAKDVTTSEPEPTWFTIPAGYKVIDHRNSEIRNRQVGVSG
jgi:hypothetical protein